MTKTDVIAYYRTGSAAAIALKRSKSAISQWPEELPFELQCYIEVMSDYKLKADRPGSTGSEQDAA